jgi:hypothetical protein
VSSFARDWLIAPHSGLNAAEKPVVDSLVIAIHAASNATPPTSSNALNASAGSSAGASANANPNPNESISTASDNAYAQRIAALADTGRMQSVLFELRQFSPPNNWQGGIDLNQAPSKRWGLHVIANADNPSMARDAYARLLSVRDALLKAGVPSHQIQLQVISLNDASRLSAEAGRRVFVVERPL